MNAPVNYRAEIDSLESISRHRVLTIAESLRLEELIYHGPRSKAAKVVQTEKTTHTRRFDATLDAWRVNAEIANEEMLAALDRYFKRGGRA